MESSRKSVNAETPLKIGPCGSVNDAVIPVTASELQLGTRTGTVATRSMRRA
jgi:hypothetical protein